MFALLENIQMAQMYVNFAIQIVQRVVDPLIQAALLVTMDFCWKELHVEQHAQIINIRIIWLGIADFAMLHV